MVGIKNIINHFGFVRKKPRVIFRIINGYFKTLILRKNVLRTIDWAITYRCNFNCEYCSAKDLQKSNIHNKELTVEQIKNVWEEARKLGVIHVNLTGGEPTLRGIDTLCEIIKNFHPKEHLISMVTNASLLKEEDIKKLVYAGLDTIQLSIESVNPEYHNKIRRAENNYQKIMEVMSWSKKYDLNICLSAVLTHNNFDEIKKLLDFTKKEKVFFLINPASTSGNWKTRDDIKINKEDMDKYYSLLKNANVRADTVLNFRGKSGCPAGVERIEISATGEVMTCPHVQVTYGNVLQEPLNKIYYRISNFPVLKKFEKHCRHVFNEQYIKDFVFPQREAEKVPISVFDLPIVKKDKRLHEFLESTK